MNRLFSIASLAALAIAAPVTAEESEQPEYPSPNAIVEAAPASDWLKIAPSDLLVMDLAPDAEGNTRRVVIQLMPPPFSQGWIRNIRKLAASHRWDGTSINRVQDNYVVQWGDAGYDNPESGETEQKVLPEGLETVPESEYVQPQGDYFSDEYDLAEASFKPGDEGQAQITSTVSKVIEILDNIASDGSSNHKPFPPSLHDAYQPFVGYWRGWQLSGDSFHASPIHCYGAVGVGRNYSPDTGSGAELYTVIGHAPRHLDRNIAVVGRVIEGIEYLSSLPRGKGQLGFYEDASKRVPISSIRMASALPAADQPRFEYLDTEGETFAQYADARANRRDPFFIVPAGGADICNIPVPVRRVTGE